MTLSVAALWRYPIKTLAGERLETAELTTDGIPGDRVVLVRGPEGIRTSRRFHRLLGLHATLDQAGEPLVNNMGLDGPKGPRPRPRNRRRRRAARTWRYLRNTDFATSGRFVYTASTPSLATAWSCAGVSAVQV